MGVYMNMNTLKSGKSLTPFLVKNKLLRRSSLRIHVHFILKKLKNFPNHNHTWLNMICINILIKKAFAHVSLTEK